MSREYPIEKVRDIGIIAHIDVPICSARSAVSKSRILDFVSPFRGDKIGTGKIEIYA